MAGVAWNWAWGSGWDAPRTGARGWSPLGGLPSLPLPPPSLKQCPARARPLYSLGLAPGARIPPPSWGSQALLVQDGWALGLGRPLTGALGSSDLPAVRPPVPGHTLQPDLPPHDPALGPGRPQPPHLRDGRGQGLQHEAQAEERLPKRPGQGGPDHR